MIQAILSLLLGLPPHISDRDELPQDRHDRLTVVAQDIATASRGSLQVASALITLGSFESHYARWVGLGCVGAPPAGVGNCDKGKARSYWQLHRAGCPAWASGEQSGLAACAARAWSGAFQRCGRTLKWAYSGYASGSCEWLRDAPQRAAMHLRVLAQLESRLVAKGEQW